MPVRESPRRAPRRRAPVPAPKVLFSNGKRELWIGDDRQGIHDPRRPGACGRGWYWPLMARLCVAYLRGRKTAVRERITADDPRRRGSGDWGQGSGEDKLEALFLGLGAATVPRLLARRFPELPMTAVERDARVIALCRRHFDPPESLRVVRADAARYARARGDRYSILVEDVFSAATQGAFDPASGLDANYFRALWNNRLAPGGLLLINLFSDPEYAPGRRALRKVLSEFATPRRFTPKHGANEVWALIRTAGK